MDNCTKEGAIAGLQSDVKTIFKRMDEQLSITKAVYELTAEIRVMNNRLKTIENGQEQLKQDVEEMKAKPGKRWEVLIASAITAIVGLVIGLFVSGGIAG